MCIYVYKHVNTCFKKYYTFYFSFFSSLFLLSHTLLIAPVIYLFFTRHWCSELYWKWKMLINFKSLKKKGKFQFCLIYCYCCLLFVGHITFLFFHDTSFKKWCINHNNNLLICSQADFFIFFITIGSNFFRKPYSCTTYPHVPLLPAVVLNTKVISNRHVFKTIKKMLGQWISFINFAGESKS